MYLVEKFVAEKVRENFAKFANWLRTGEVNKDTCEREANDKCSLATKNKNRLKRVSLMLCKGKYAF